MVLRASGGTQAYSTFSQFSWICRGEAARALSVGQRAAGGWLPLSCDSQAQPPNIASQLHQCQLPAGCRDPTVP